MDVDSDLKAFLSGLIAAYQDDRPAGLSYSNLVTFDNPTQMYALALAADPETVVAISVVHDSEIANGAVQAFRFDSESDIVEALDHGEIVFDLRELPLRQAIQGWLDPDYSTAERTALHLKRSAGVRGGISAGDFKVEGQMIVQSTPPGSLLTAQFVPPFPLPLMALAALGTLPQAASASPPPEDPPPAAASQPAKQSAFAAYADPPLWFGDSPHPTAAEAARGETVTSKTQLAKDEVVARLDIGNVDVMVTQKGQITAISADSEAALDVINGVLAAVDRSGIGQLAVGTDDLVTISDLDPATGEMRSFGGRVVERNQRLDRMHGRMKGRTAPTTLYVIQKERAAEVLAVAADCHSDVSSRVRSLRLFDASTLRARGHATEAFIVAWSLIENWIEKTFLAYWETSGKKRSGTPTMQWSAAQRTDVLLASGALSQADFDAIDELRRRRNGIVHRLEVASEQDAERCLAVAGVLCQLPTCSLDGTSWVFFGAVL